MDKPCNELDIPAWKQVYANHFSINNNRTRAYLHAKPHVTLSTAQREGSLASKDPVIIKLVNEAISKRVDKQRYSKEQILDNIDVIRKKSLNKQEFGTSLKANKEIAELCNHYDRGSDDPGKYQTLIQSLIVNHTTISSGTPPKQVEHAIEAEFEDVQPVDNIEDNE